MKTIFKVVQQGETFAVQSPKAERGQTLKCNIVLQELGGNLENQYVCTMLGNMALCRFYAGNVVAASLHFSTRDHNGAKYQDILVTEIVKLS